ncbi:MAG: GHKL domain-containing protein [Cyclobacteriaceae bacterium]
MLTSRSIALILSTSISLITTAFLSLLQGIPTPALWLAFVSSFGATYIVVLIMVEFLFFKEIEKLRDLVQNQGEITSTKKYRNFLAPLKEINDELSSYAGKKQEEIEQLKRMEVFRREFIADISHELKTPIFAAQGFVHTLLDGAVNDKKVRTKFLKKAAKSLDGLDRLVQNLLTISQMEIGEITMHYESFDIVDLCVEVYDQLVEKAHKKEIILRFAEDYDGNIVVHADYQRIYQVIVNLISNAIKYTKKNGDVVIEIEEEDNFVTIAVSDKGRGIPPEDLDRIFERFYRVDKSRSKAKGGTGLGLSIVKHIMEGHDTKIEVESELGVGSRFWFKLPVGDPSNQKAKERREEDEEIGFV